MRKKLLAFFMSFVMIVTFMPTMAFVSFAETAVDSAFSTGGKNIGITADVRGSIDKLNTWEQNIKTMNLDKMLFCGDYSSAFDESFIADCAKAADTTQTNGLNGIYTCGEAEYGMQQTLVSFFDGQMPNFTRIGWAVEPKDDTYGVYCLGAAGPMDFYDGSVSYTLDDIKALDAALASASADASKPIFVMGHFPLHAYMMSMPGMPQVPGMPVTKIRTKNAERLIDVLNKYPNVVFLWGHSYSANDSHYGEIKQADDRIEYASGRYRKINFTYACAGAMFDKDSYVDPYAAMGMEMPESMQMPVCESEFKGLVANVNGSTVTMQYFGYDGKPVSTATKVTIGTSSSPETYDDYADAEVTPADSSMSMYTAVVGETFQLDIANTAGADAKYDLIFSVDGIASADAASVDVSANASKLVSVKGLKEGFTTLYVVDENTQAYGSLMLTVTNQPLISSWMYTMGYTQMYPAQADVTIPGMGFYNLYTKQGESLTVDINNLPMPSFDGITPSIRAEKKTYTILKDNENVSINPSGGTITVDPFKTGTITITGGNESGKSLVQILDGEMPVANITVNVIDKKDCSVNLAMAMMSAYDQSGASFPILDLNIGDNSTVYMTNAITDWTALGQMFGTSDPTQILAMFGISYKYGDQLSDYNFEIEVEDDSIVKLENAGKKHINEGASDSIKLKALKSGSTTITISDKDTNPATMGMMAKFATIIVNVIDPNEDKPEKHYDESIHYLAIGDSIGAGVKGGNGDNREYNNFSAYDEDGKKNWRTDAVSYSYVNLFADAIGANPDNNHNGTYAGLRAKEICKILDLQPRVEGDYNYNLEQITWDKLKAVGFDMSKYLIPDYFGYNYYNTLTWQNLFNEYNTDRYKQAIKEADIITIELGANDLNAYLQTGPLQRDILPRLMMMVQSLSVGSRSDTEKLQALRSDLKNLLKDLLSFNTNDINDVLEDLRSIGTISDRMGTAGAELSDLIDVISDTLQYARDSYRYYWTTLLDYIHANNKDAKIIVTSVPNPLKGSKSTPANMNMGMGMGAGMGLIGNLNVTGNDVAFMLEPFIDDMNRFLISNADKYKYQVADISDANLNPLKKNGDPDPAYQWHPNNAGHKYICEQLLKCYNDSSVTMKADNRIAGVIAAVAGVGIAGGLVAAIAKISSKLNSKFEQIHKHKWDSDYTVDKKASFDDDGKQSIHCSGCNETMDEQIIAKAVATLKSDTTVYNGEVQKPTIVTNGLVEGQDYTVEVGENKNPGIYNITVTLKGKYEGEKVMTYTILPQATKITSLKKGSKSFTVQWKKLATQTTGYQIRYSTNSDMSSAKTVKVTKNTTVSKKISKLKAQKKYYVQVRTYKNTGDTTLYSVWSAKKSVKTTK